MDDDLKKVIQIIVWSPKFTFVSFKKTFDNQTAYNKKFEMEFSIYN